MPKLAFDSLSIEVTRRCNQRCAHCMRGEAQNKDLDPAVLDSLFFHTDSIADLVPTGGEPSLNVPGIRAIRDALNAHNVGLSSVYLVTNGLAVDEDFIAAFLSLYALCDDTECCGLALSQDVFHEAAPKKARRMLEGLSCFSPDDKKIDWNKTPLLNVGRAKELITYQTREPSSGKPFANAEVYDNGDIWLCDSIMTLTVDGDLLAGCDYAYDDTESIWLANVKDPDWFERFYDKTLRAIWC